jgi:hypothetical protein
MKYSIIIILLFATLKGFGQEKTLTGIVTAENGELLPGSNVVVKHTQRGIQTDIDGKFSIKVTSKDTLVFSFVGMLTKEIVVGNAKSIDIKLLDGPKLEESVGPGYRAPKRNPISVAVKEIEKTKADTVRWYTSLNENDQPLYVVDGVFVTAVEMAKINPETIKSVNVLKNGNTTFCSGRKNVIVIKTKKLSKRELRKMKRIHS